MVPAIPVGAQPTVRAQVQSRLATSRATYATDTAASRRAAQQAYALARAAGLDSLAVSALIQAGLSGVNAPERAAWVITYMRAARAQAQVRGLRAEVARTYRTEGEAEEGRGQFAAAQAAFRAALELWRQLGNTHEMMVAYNDLGVVHRSAGQYPEAMEAHLQQLRLSESTHSQVPQIIALRNLGALSQVLDDLPGAVAYTTRALALLRGQPRLDTVALVGVHAALGLLFQEQQRYRAAWQHLLAGLRLGQQLHTATARAELGYLVHGLGEVAYAQRDYRAALGYYQRAVTLFEQNDQSTPLVSALNALALAQQQMGQWGPALRSAQQALALSKKLKSAYGLLGSYEDFAALSALRYEYAAAYRYQLRSHQLSDSLFTVERAAQLAHFTARYQAGQKEAQIRLLRGQAALQKAETRWERFTRDLLAVGLLLAVAAGAATYHRYRLQRRTSQKLRAAEAESRIRNDELEYVQQRLRRSLNDKEVLLKEIHHRVKNNLQIVSSLLALQAQAQNRLPHVVAALREGQNWVKSIALAHELLYQADDLAQIDFQQFAEQLVRHLQRTFAVPAVQVTVQGEGVWLSTDAAVPLGLIVNELLSNAFKYAFANGRPGTVAVALGPDLAAEARQYRLVVTDDGPGLPPDFVVSRASSLGLRLVQSLAHQLGGALHLPSPGQPNAEFVVTFPVPDGSPVG
ncbi:sensor histidine kinase [Hymenobacter terrenus]|uniref:sensor histidine kinase n=1 Tax=Hymenobacter terrenus TaxID=1629124 RepID=UPI000697AE0F|nr:histidine kinase dimerization/phosphoacceptor domain -containing protein [Hymenobacter terrenus]